MPSTPKIAPPVAATYRKSIPSAHPTVILVWNQFRDESVTLVSTPQARQFNFYWGHFDGICIEGDCERNAWHRLALLMGATGSFSEDECTDEVLRDWWQYICLLPRDVESPLDLAGDPELVGARVVSVFLCRAIDRPQTRIAKRLEQFFCAESRNLTLSGSEQDRAGPDCAQDPPREAAPPPTGKEPHGHPDIGPAGTQTLPV
ncbi:hypothetical protein [Paraburkholderia dioscoreae]|uniref:Uncharacterized protein n=1 Tax=Paraburkholderia dioscoreae TaxID=2604047 RepID=A0A5Q4ZML1_9BURK|nr:hypothetical protein [Paraburkholderia dioscoreae]VVD29196.1 protein of unknown function [Paraburkholderia dioscoreae]